VAALSTNVTKQQHRLLEAVMLLFVTIYCLLVGPNCSDSWQLSLSAHTAAVDRAYAISHPITSPLSQKEAEGQPGVDTNMIEHWKV